MRSGKRSPGAGSGTEHFKMGGRRRLKFAIYSRAHAFTRCGKRDRAMLPPLTRQKDLAVIAFKRGTAPQYALRLLRPGQSNQRSGTRPARAGSMMMPSVSPDGGPGGVGLFAGPGRGERPASANILPTGNTSHSVSSAAKRGLTSFICIRGYPVYYRERGSTGTGILDVAY